MREEAGAYFNTDSLIEVDGEMLQLLKRRAREAPKQRFRLCLHHTTGDPVQEMIVVHCRGMYSRPHRHSGRCMSFQMIEGEQIVYLFNDAGQVTGSIQMGPCASGKTFCFRLEPGRWYMPVTQSEYAVFHETLAGPNRADEGTEYAAWSPGEDDHAGIQSFLEKTINPQSQ